MNIFKESQLQRDSELSAYLNKPLDYVQKLVVGDKASIHLHTDKDVKADSYDFIYKEYKAIPNVDAYLKTLAQLTVSRRSKYILSLEKTVRSLKNKHILDFGCGVGSHGIYCLQKGATVDFLDVDGPLFNFAKHRISKRGYKSATFTDSSKLQKNAYDCVICLDVLEHVANPINEIKKITDSLKFGGVLLLEVSTMIKPTSGHFSQSINMWKNHGTKFLKENFKNVEKFIYVKI